MVLEEWVTVSGDPKTQNDVWEAALVAVSEAHNWPDSTLATTQPDSDLSTHDQHVSLPGFMDHLCSTKI